jgi:hypothetical protein
MLEHHNRASDALLAVGVSHRTSLCKIAGNRVLDAREQILRPRLLRPVRLLDPLVVR